MNLSYRRHPAVGLSAGPPPVARTPAGGRIVLDVTLARLLERADGRTLEQLLQGPDAEGRDPLLLRLALACLAEAGLVERVPPAPAPPAPAASRGPLVSAVIVAHDGVRWLEPLLPTLAAQSHTPIEVVVVDNGSRDATAEWVATHAPEATLVRLPPGGSLAAAVNRGAGAARGEYLLILNQDVRLEPGAVAELVRVAAGDPGCAAVAAKLRLLAAPAFLNGLGNRIEPRSWGTDNGIGQLDLGQFDGWQEVPSCCFAAALVPREAWRQVGPVDEGFPFYYEDVEWSYRARALGFRVRVAPRAVVLHAFGGSAEDGSQGLPPGKLRRVVYGRLRLAVKLLPAGEAARYLLGYAVEDAAGLLAALRSGDGAAAQAYATGWRALLGSLPELRRARRALAPHRVSPGRVARACGLDPAPPPARGAALELTWEQVSRALAKHLRDGRLRPLPELGSSSP